MSPVVTCPYCQDAGFLHPRLPSGDVDYARLIPCRCTQRKLEENRAERLHSHSNLGAFSRLTFENLILEGRSDDPSNQGRFLQAYRAATRFASTPQGWLVFMGPSGCGKTHLAAAIANQRLQAGQPVFFIGVPDLLDHLRATYDPNSEVSYDELFAETMGASLLVLDDLGTQANSPWAEEKLFQLMNHRYAARLPTVINVSAGVTLDELQEKWRMRLTDPALSEVHVLEVRSPSNADYSDVLVLELLRSMSFDNFDCKRVNLPLEQRQNLEQIFMIAHKFAESPEGWLILQGENGCGKTHLAAAIANYRLKRSQPVSFLIVPDFLDHLRSTFSPDCKVTYDELFERVKTCPLLVLDDYGEHSGTPWAQEKLYQLINYRYNARLPMVVTMSCSLEETEGRIGSRLADPRLSLVYYILAPDYRTDRAVLDRSKNPVRRNRRS